MNKLNSQRIGMVPRFIISAGLTMLCWTAQAASDLKGCGYSAAWGAGGEKWRAEGRIPDFSFAGYRAGEAEIPRDPKIKWNFNKDFGGVGDGKTDNTEAFKNALKATGKGVLFVPAGRYIISDKISFAKSNFVLRGEGPGKTIFLLTKSLTDLFGNKPDNKGYSQYSFGPGMINFSGANQITSQTLLLNIVAPAKRGEKILKVSSTNGIEVGQWIRIVESDDISHSLVDAFYNNLGAPAKAIAGSQNIGRFLSRIESICQTKSGNLVNLERPLPYDIRPEWKPEIHSFQPKTTEVGIEDLSFEFPWTPYPGHFKEQGLNGLFINRTANCWVKNVEFINSDFGIYLNETDFCTLTDIRFSVTKPRDTLPESKGMNGHHGIDIGNGTENLVTKFRFDTKFVHDLSVDWYTMHSVFSEGSGINMNMDHHRAANHSNLFTNLDCGICTRPFDSSGQNDRGDHAGAYSTFWNIHGKSAQIPLPDNNFGPVVNLIGSFTDRSGTPGNWLKDLIPAKHLCPANLHEAMKSYRIK